MTIRVPAFSLNDSEIRLILGLPCTIQQAFYESANGRSRHSAVRVNAFADPYWNAIDTDFESRERTVQQPVTS